MAMEGINMVEVRLRRRKIQYWVLKSSSVERDRGDDLEDIKKLEPATTEKRDNNNLSLDGKIHGKCFKKEYTGQLIKLKICFQLTSKNSWVEIGVVLMEWLEPKTIWTGLEGEKRSEYRKHMSKKFLKKFHHEEGNDL